MKAFAKSKSRRLRFEAFEFDLDTVELRKNGRRIRLQDQPSRLLALLAARPAELVTRTEIQKTLWEEGQFVEFDHAVNTAIKKVREALDDDPESPRIIETLPRKGYRFIASVEWVEDEVMEPEALEIAPVDVLELPDAIVPSTPVTPDVVVDVRQEPAPAMEPPAAAPHRSPLLWVLAALVLVLLTGLALRNSGAGTETNPIPELRLEIMTPSTADPTSVAISPDGVKVVFVAISEGRSQLRLRSLETGFERSLAGTDGALFPFWSPNNRSVGFFADGFLKRTDIDGGLLASSPKLRQDGAAPGTARTSFFLLRMRWSDL
jgi:DNA-binding winged helix-turn-helix (wHTH) protein